MNPRIRIALIDWDMHVRAGRRMLIESIPDFQVVFEGRGSISEIGELGDALVDVLIIDQRLESISGIEFVNRFRQLFAEAAELPGIVLTAPYESAALRVAAIEAGFDSLVSLEEGAEAMLKSISLVASGGVDLSLDVLFELVGRVRPSNEPDLQFVDKVQSLSKVESKPIGQLQSAWKKLAKGGSSSFDISSLNPLLSALDTKTPSEMIIRLYRSGLLDEI